MKDKTKETWKTIFGGFIAIVIIVSIVGAAVIYKTDLNYNSNPLFILSVIGLVAGFTIIVIAIAREEISNSDIQHFH